MLLPTNYRKGHSLQTLIENKTTFSLDRSEMSIYETHLATEKIYLDFSDPVLATMISGRKIMRMRGMDTFSFVPGESVMLPSNEYMDIDFPDATEETPTKCLTLSVDQEKMQAVTEFMNEKMPKADAGIWKFSSDNFHFTNSTAVHQIINRLIFLYAEDHPSKDVFVDMTLQELFIRILQTESADFLLHKSTEEKTSNRLAFVVDYIRRNLHEKLTIGELCKKSYMSESSFFRSFKNEIGVSPVDFINEERVKMAAGLLAGTNKKVSEIYLHCGFNSLSYFNRVFKKQYGVSPNCYRKSLMAD